MSQVVFSTKRHKPEEERGGFHPINLSSGVLGEHENHRLTHQRLQRIVQGLIDSNRMRSDQLHKAYLKHNQHWIAMTRQYKTESVGLWSREDYGKCQISRSIAKKQYLLRDDRVGAKRNIVRRFTRTDTHR